jgi:hypothetical protein
MRPGMSEGNIMAITLNDVPVEGGTRDRVARALGVAGALYGLLAAITGAVAAAGVLGLLGLAADPATADAARMLALPWSLAAAPVEAEPALLLAVTLGGLVLNLAILIGGARLARGRTRG